MIVNIRIKTAFNSILFARTFFTGARAAPGECGILLEMVSGIDFL
jgi:hypothetical protein